MEYPMDHVRASWGCDCPDPDIHVHNDLDGERPKDKRVVAKGHNKKPPYGT